MTLILRPEYQVGDVAAMQDAYRRVRSVLYCAPTGSGKGAMLSAIAAMAAQRGNRVIILVHRQHLILQTSDLLTQWNCQHGTVAPDYPEQPEYNVQVASVQSLNRRLHRWLEWNPKLIIHDEAHHSVAATWVKINNAFPNVRHLGMTATPGGRSDHKGLGAVFDELIMGPSMRKLIDLDFLADYRIFAPQIAPDLKGIRKLAGDFNTGELAERMDKVTITGETVAHYKKHLAGAPAIAFCVTLAHAHHVAEQYRHAGLQSTVIEGTTDPQSRKEMLADLGAGRLNVLCSCMVISEGLDAPTVQGAILLRPTESTILYLQMVGRALRPKPDKSKAIILDHSGCSLTLGLPSDDREWSLANGLVQQAKRPGSGLRTCSSCFSIYRGSSICPTCGFENKKDKPLPKSTDGELTEADPRFVAKLRELEQRAKDSGEFAQLERIRIQKRYRPGWSYYVLRGRLHKRAMRELQR